jgi:hypothetical protein
MANEGHLAQLLQAIAAWNQWRNWLRVLGTAELSHIDQSVRQQLHAKMSLLHVFKTQQQPLEFVLPRKGPIDPSSQGMDSSIEQALSPLLGSLPIARILFNVRDHTSIKNTLAVVRGIKPSIEVEICTFEH